VSIAPPRRAPIARRAEVSYVRHRGSLLKKQRKTGRIKLFLVIFLLLCGWIGWAILARKTAPTANSARTRFDALVVLGTPTDSDGHPTARQLAAVNEAVREYERGIAPRIIFTGGAARNRFVEAEAMAQVAESEGIPPSAVLIENQARNTAQNACFATRILRQRGLKSAEIVGLAAHLPRTALILQSLPLDWQVHAAPPLTPPSPVRAAFSEGVETLKTMRYLVWARLTEQCEL
jgi:uncharacterized SAM-binding protein YcdF (DUF218 family)